MTDKIGYTRKGDVAVLRIKNPPVNALSHAVREGLVAGMAQAEADDGVKAVVIVGEGRAFIAGADITEFGKRRWNLSCRMCANGSRSPR